jgi:decaprenylphospho-beta-D-erythro-pentofuranosid-2-ulose 2-reductase
MPNGHIIIYGGSSLISKELIGLLAKSYGQFTVFCRKKNDVENNLKEVDIKNLKVNIYECDLVDLEKNFSIIEGIENNISGVIWVSGFTGNADEEFLDPEKGEKNIRVNFLNPILITNKIIPKMVLDSNSFIVAISSVAGLRGRAKQLFYSSAKSALIAYMSALRQKLVSKKINVITVIPGYMKTKPFISGGWKAPSFLIASPNKVAKVILKAINSKKEIVYVNFIWRIIMFFIVNIPEKIFKNLKF